MATEFVTLGAQGINQGVDSAIQLADGNGVVYKIRANADTGGLEIVKAGTVVSTIGASSGSATQETNRTNGVTVSAMKGTITTHTASLAGLATATFIVTNTLVAIGDVICLSIRSGSNSGGAAAVVGAVAAGSFSISVQNNNAAAGTAETGAIIINFAVIKV